ncbi:dTMP kinase [Lipingzhangella halophila]|uniref:Thymidylate kinase n=1 Tax=Lipingzhangella halophila TaxID=1783352 RepID=A0A7W7RMI9_9ACTN|nr:dTMP kinase [Lipingzhangella halophila]MBB4934727.1 dTMP kinase [Lipingzhangella halophila]
MSRSASLGAPGEARNVLAIKPFRRLWISLLLSSLGDWLALFALISLAAVLTAESSAIIQASVISGVVALRLVPPLAVGPFTGALTNRVDNRLTMAIGDVLRALLYISVPIVSRIDWLLIAAFLVACVVPFREAAKDASVPDLVPTKRMDQAHQVNMLTGFATAPVAAVVFTVLAALTTLLATLVPAMGAPQAGIALYANGAAFLAAAVVTWMLPAVKPAAPEPAHPEPQPAGEVDSNELTAPMPQTREVPVAQPVQRPTSPSTPDSFVLRTLWKGMRFAGTTPVVRGLVLGMLGSFALAGVLLGTGRVFADRLGAGNAVFGVLVAAFSIGMALGVYFGPRVLRGLSRRRLFGLCLGVSGIALFLAGLIPNLVLAAVLAVIVGTGAGIAWAVGLSLLGQELEEDVRDRTFVYLHAASWTLLLLFAALAPLLAGVIGDYPLAVRDLSYDFLGSGAVLMGTGLLGVVLAVLAYRQVSERAEVSFRTELIAALRGVPATPAKEAEKLPGTFVVLEGGEGAGKSTQVGQLTVWLREEGFEVVTTREPGATKLGMRLRALLLDKDDMTISARTEALLYIADRANHIEEVILPALRRGAIVISDRYVDSTIAYQGAGRDLDSAGVEMINAWATEDLIPHLTVLLDLPVEDGLARVGGSTDRMESEPQEFHTRVRKGFRDLAERDPGRYLIVDARMSQEEVTREIQRRVRPLLPDPVPQDAEAITGMMPTIKTD